MLSDCGERCAQNGEERNGGSLEPQALIELRPDGLELGQPKACPAPGRQPVVLDPVCWNDGGTVKGGGRVGG